jgi:hypothetical protein
MPHRQNGDLGANEELPFISKKDYIHIMYVSKHIITIYFVPKMDEEEGSQKQSLVVHSWGQ